MFCHFVCRDADPNPTARTSAHGASVRPATAVSRGLGRPRLVPTSVDNACESRALRGRYLIGMHVTPDTCTFSRPSPRPSRARSCGLPVRLWLGALTCLTLLSAIFVAEITRAAPVIWPDTRVAIVRPPRKSFDGVVALMQRELTAAGHDVRVIELPPSADAKGSAAALSELDEFQPHVIATGGEHVTERVLEAVPRTPVVFFMLVNADSAPFMQRSSPHFQRVCGVTSDSNHARQIDWISKIDPSCKKIGVIHSARLTPTLNAIVRAAKARNIETRSIVASKDGFPAAIVELNRTGCDAALMIPDSGVYNQHTIRRLILWGLRQKKPVWAFSRNIVKAGALGGLFYDKTDVAGRTVETIQAIVEGAKPSAVGVRYPHRILRVLNADTAKQIDLRLNRRNLDPDVEWIQE